MTEVYDEIGRGYDGTRRADPKIGDALVRLLEPVVDARYLDIACGTGNYTVDLAARGIDMAGVDISLTMLTAAAAKSKQVRWLCAAVDSLPFADACFAGAMCTLAVHHFDDLARALADLRRVLKPAARFTLFTGTAEQMRHYWLNHYFPDAMRRSIEQMPAASEIRAALKKAGFEGVATEPFFVTDDLKDLFLYSGKTRPHLYLDPAIRAGISTFAKLTDASELKAGLARPRPTRGRYRERRNRQGYFIE